MASDDLEWIRSLSPIGNHEFEFQGCKYLGSLTYFPADAGSKLHSIVLKIERALTQGHRSYLAGFSFDEENKIIPILDEVLYSCD